MKLPDFEVQAQDGFGFSVGWQDATRRYHFWITKQGKPKDDILHSNPLDPTFAPYGPSGHRALDLTAKKWAPTVEAILQKIGDDDLIAKALAARAAKLKAEDEERQRKINAERIERLSRAVALLPAALQQAFAVLPESTLLDFATAYEA